MALRAARVGERVLHAVQLVREVAARVPGDVHCGEVENTRPSADAFADVARDAGEALAMAGVVASEVRRDGRLSVVKAVELALVEMARDAERVARPHGV